MKMFRILTMVAAIIATAAITYAATTNRLNMSTAQDVSNISPAERTKIETIIHDYLISKPEVLVEALQVLQKKQFDEAQKTVKQTQSIAPQYAEPLFHQPKDPSAGNENAPVTIVEFFDYQCPHCADMAPVLDALVRDDQDIRVVFKEFAIRGPISEFAARAALAANLQGKYLIYNHALFKLPSPLTQESILQAAKDVGLDVDKLKADMESQPIKDQLKETTKLGTDLKLFGTPAFFIGKTATKENGTITYYPGEMKKEQMIKEVNKYN